MNNPLVFISHSSQDKEVARQLASEFRDRGLEIWIDHERIEFGASIPKAIEEGLTQSACIVVMISPAFLESNWCRTEYESLLAQEIEQDRILVVPVLIEECDIPLLLSQKLYADLRESSQRSNRLDILAKQIRERFSLGQGIPSIDFLESAPKKAWDATRSPGEPLLASLQRRLENDFFVSGQRIGEFGKTRSPNEAHLYHGAIREVLKHKPYYYLTYWGWEAIESLLPWRAEEWAKLTETALKSRFANKRWIEVDLENYESGPTVMFKRAVTVRHTVKAAEILMLNNESTVASQVAWDLINDESLLSGKDGGWKEFSAGETHSSLWSSINVFRFLSKLRNRICPGDVPGELESFMETSTPLIRRTEEYLESDWRNNRWKFNNLPSEINAPLVLIDYLPFGQNLALVENIYQALRELVTPAGRLVDPEFGVKYAAPEYVLSVRLAYALSLSDSIRARTDSRVERLADWCLTNYSNEITLDTCDIAFLTNLIGLKVASS